MPVGAVLAVLAFSYLSPLPTAASNLNNCGVKGYGYHDHGKPCPNRPFPGQGNGITKFLVSGTTATATTGAGAPSKSDANSSAPANSPTTQQPTVSNGHGHAKGHARGNGHH